VEIKIINLWTISNLWRRRTSKCSLFPCIGLHLHSKKQSK